MKFSLENKVAIITGGGSGIGESISKAFAMQGSKVHILDFNFDAAVTVANKINSSEKKAIPHKCDISNQKEVFDVIEKIARTESINILVNNAGIAHVGTIEQTTEEDMDKLYEVNIKGVYNCTKSCIPFFKKNREGGVIINLTSIASSVGISERFAYSMTKGAVLTMTYSIAKDYLDYKIRCNSISPGRVHTPFVDNFIAKNYPNEQKEMFNKLSKTQPIGRMGKPHEIADLALYLCSDEASFITGSNYAIDGGFVTLNG